MNGHEPMPAVLAELHPMEHRSVLMDLLECHPELQKEAEQYATDILTNVDVEAVANEVIDVFLGMDHTLIGTRSGRQPGRGYVHEVDAAWELLNEAFEAFVVEVDRRRRLGLDDAAQRYVDGVLTGLEEVRQTAGDSTVFGWGPPDEASAELGAQIRNAVSLA
jgi:hypothetical protein